MNCPVQKKCSGCQLRNLSYKQQLEWKQNRLAHLYRDILPITKPILGMAEPEHYRNKAVYAFLPVGKSIRPGIYQSREQTAVVTNQCLLHPPRADAIAATAAKLAASYKLSVFCRDNPDGMLRHLMVRTARATGQVMAVLCVRDLNLRKKRQLAGALLQAHPEITTLVLNAAQSDKIMLGQEQEVLSGPGYIEDILCGLRFRISPHSFYQINPVQTERLYQTALDWAQLEPEQTVLDAHCGIGTIGITASGRCGRVIGTETVAQAVRDAQVNAKLNQTANASFHQADAGTFLTAQIGQGKLIDTVFLDPPRSGCTRQLLTALGRGKPGRIVYISCNGATQVRDIRSLMQAGYTVRCVQGFDLFPHTRHMESVALLTRTPSNET